MFFYLGHIPNKNDGQYIDEIRTFVVGTIILLI